MKSQSVRAIIVTILLLANISFADQVSPGTNANASVSVNQTAEQLVIRKIPEGERGVNFVLNIAYTGPATSASETTIPSIPKVPAMSVRFVSLYDALKVVCEVTGTKFRVNGNIVTIVQSN